MGVRQIKIEDIQVDIPTDVDNRWSKSTRRTITGGLLTRKTENVGSTGFNLRNVSNTSANQLLELTRNYAYNSTVVIGLGRIWDARFVIDNISIDYLWYDRNITIGGTLQLNPTWTFIGKTMERPVHNRWKYLIDECFTGFPAPIVGTYSSTGNDLQEQTIVWEELSGTWTVSTTFAECGTNVVYCNSTVEGVLAAGWDWWDNYRLSVRIWRQNINQAHGIVFRVKDANEFYNFRFDSGTTVSLCDYETAIKTVNYTSTSARYYLMTVECQGERIRCYINGKKLIDTTHSKYVCGRVGLYTNYGMSERFDSCRVVLLPPENMNIPADAGWVNQAIVDVNTAFGIQKQVTTPEARVEFKIDGSDCILYLPMDEGSGTPRDHSKNNNVVLRTGGEWIEDEEKGWVLEWDGTAGDILYVDLPNNSPTVYTIDFEVRADIFAYGYAVYFESFQPLWYIGGTPNAWSWYYDGNAVLRYPEASMNVGQWYRVTFIVDSVNDWCECFLDGQLIGRIAQAGVNPLGDDYVGIGNNTGGGGLQPWRGAVRQLRVYDSIRWDVARGFDSTPATVFVWDDNRFDPSVTIPDDSDCVLLLHMDEGEGSVCYDASGKAHDATLTTAPDWYGTSFRGEAGTGLDFDSGSSEYLTIADHDDFSFVGDHPYSFEAWCKFETVSVVHIIASKYLLGVSKREWTFAVSSDNKFTLELFDDVNNSYDHRIAAKSTTEPVVGVWYHVVVTYDGSKSWTGIKIYINGIAETTTNSSAGTYNGMGNGGASVGIGYNGSSNYYNGIMDEVRIHRRELSANEVAARYRSEPYLHDWYTMTRVYDKHRKWKGMPVISNGQVLLSFPVYDLHEYRSANILMPLLYGWYENAWNMIGFFEPYVSYATETKELSVFKYSEWEIVELTDQYCKMRITYIDPSDADWPVDYKNEMYFIVRNGYPGVLLEPIDDYQTDENNDRAGFLFKRAYTEGVKPSPRFVYLPKDSLYDADPDTSIGLTTAAVDDNWWIAFHDRDVPQWQFIFGGFSDSMLDDYGGGTQWYLADSNGYYLWYFHQTTYGGLFFMPYNPALMYKDGYYLAGTGSAAGSTPTGYTGMGSWMLNSNAETGFWDVASTPELAKGVHCAVFRVYNQYGGSGGNTLRYAVTNGLGSDIVFDTYTWGATTEWRTFYLMFTTDGTIDIELWTTSTTIASGAIYVDYMLCIPVSNSRDWPSNLAQRGLNDTKVIRA